MVDRDHLLGRSRSLIPAVFIGALPSSLKGKEAAQAVQWFKGGT